MALTKEIVSQEARQGLEDMRQRVSRLAYLIDQEMDGDGQANIPAIRQAFTAVEGAATAGRFFSEAIMMGEPTNGPALVVESAENNGSPKLPEPSPIEPELPGSFVELLRSKLSEKIASGELTLKSAQKFGASTKALDRSAKRMGIILGGDKTEDDLARLFYGALTEKTSGMTQRDRWGRSQVKRGLLQNRKVGAEFLYELASEIGFNWNDNTVSQEEALAVKGLAKIKEADLKSDSGK